MLELNHHSACLETLYILDNCPCCGVWQLSILSLLFLFWTLFQDCWGRWNIRMTRRRAWKRRSASTTVPREPVSSRLEAKAWLAIDPFRASLNRGFRIQNIVILYHSLLVALSKQTLVSNDRCNIATILVKLARSWIILSKFKMSVFYSFQNCNRDKIVFSIILINIIKDCIPVSTCVNPWTKFISISTSQTDQCQMYLKYSNFYQALTRTHWQKTTSQSRCPMWL